MSGDDGEDADEDTEDMAPAEPSAPVSDVLPWLVDELPDCPSPGKGPPRTSIRSDPLRIPPSSLFLKALDEMDDKFQKLSFNSTFKAPRDRKREYAVHSMDAFDTGAVFDDSIARLNSSSLTRYQVADSKLRSIESELRRCYRPASYIASIGQAIQHAVDTKGQVDAGRLASLAQASGNAVCDLGDHLNAALANITIMRRTGVLSQCGWPEEFKTSLLRAPVSTSTLFGGTIPTVAKEQAAASQSEVSLRTIQAVTKLESALRQPYPRYVPTRNSSRAAVASTYRRKPRKPQNQRQGQQQQRQQYQQQPYSTRGSRSGGPPRGGHSGQRF